MKALELKNTIELVLIFMIILPIFSLSALALAGYFKNK